MRYEIGFGVGFDRDGQALPAGRVQQAIRAILVRASSVFGGCNLLNGQGAWVDGSGTLVLEDSRVLVIDVAGPGSRFTGDTEAKVQELVQFIGTVLSQHSVHVVKLVATADNTTVLVSREKI
jgi:hypothetical protein